MKENAASRFGISLSAAFNSEQLQCTVHQQVSACEPERVNHPIPPLYVRAASCKSLWRGFERAIV